MRKTLRRQGAWRLLLVPAMVSSLLVSMASGAAASDEFTDVGDGHTFHDQISWVAQEGIATGWVDGEGNREFRPGLTISRQAAMVWLYRMAGEPDTTGMDENFEDVSPEQNANFYDAIVWGAHYGITTGYEDGTEFRPQNLVNRMQMAAFIYRAVGEPEAEDGSWDSDFADVTPSNPFYEEISFLAETSLSTGWEDNTFRPSEDVTRMAMAAFLYRLELESPYVIDPNEPVTEPMPATALELTPENEVNPVDTDHTLTATLSNDTEMAPSDAQVRFEVYPAEGGDRLDGALADVEGGVATWTYTSAVADDQMLVACAGTDPCTTPANTLTVDDLTGDTNVTADVADTATKTWEERELATLSVTPAEATNPVGTDHTIAIEGVDQFGDPIQAGVLIEVFRDPVEFEGDGTESDPQVDEYESWTRHTHSSTVVDDPETEDVEGPRTVTIPTSNEPATDLIVVCNEDGDDHCATLTQDNPETPDEDEYAFSLDESEGSIVTTATKTWVEPSPVVEVSPATAENAFGTEHTVTATVTDAITGQRLEGVGVTFEVRRGDAVTMETEGTSTTAGEPATEEDPAAGTATFTYTGPEEAVTDTIYACVEGDSATPPADCVVIEADGDVNDIEGVSYGTATKSWVAPEFTLELTPESDVNMTGDTHTVTAIVTDQFGVTHTDEDVTFELYRDVVEEGDAVDEYEAEASGTEGTDEDGNETLTFTSATEAEDLVVACLLGGGETECSALDAGGQVVLNPANEAEDTATKTWVAPDAAPADGAYTGTVEQETVEVVGDEATGTITVRVGDSFLTFDVEADDTLLINGEAATDAAFDAALDAGDVIDVDYQTGPFETSTFDLTVE